MISNRPKTAGAIGGSVTDAAKSRQELSILAMGGPVDKSSPVPLYFQIAENLRKAIGKGDLAPGQRLENEIQISERLAVSRPTVRQAIQRLAHEGLVVRQRGVGTVVARQRIQRRLGFTSLYEDLKIAGRNPETKVLSATTIAADGDVAAIIGVVPGDKIHLLERLRYADGLPLAVMHNYLPYDLLGDSDLRAVLSGAGLYETLRQRQVHFQSADDVIGARKATSSEARLLDVPRGSTVLTMMRVARDPAGRVIDYGVHAYLADRYVFRQTFGPVL